MQKTRREYVVYPHELKKLRRCEVIFEEIETTSSQESDTREFLSKKMKMLYENFVYTKWEEISAL